jgi:hypothetical protein
MPTIKLTGFNTSTGRSTTAGDGDTVDVDGSLTIGNADTDAVVFNAEIDSDFIPDDNDSYDLGSSSKRWAELHCEDIYAYSDIVFSDNSGTFPTTQLGFFWDLNNDEARIYAQQPASDDINFYFKLSDNNNSDDRFVFWIDDYQGGANDRYPLVMHGNNIYMHSTESSEGIPDLSTAKINIPRSTASGATTTHKGRIFLSGNDTSDLYIRFANDTSDTENAYVFQDQSDNNALKLESHDDIAFHTNGVNERMRIASSGKVTINNDLDVQGDLRFEDTMLIELSIPGVQLQTDTNAYRFNCPYGMTITGLRLNLDQHGTSGNVTVTVASGATTMITLNITGTNLSANTTTVSSGTRSQGDVVTFAITATPTTNTNGLRAALSFRRTLS